jgi:hypothetical protein
MKLNTNHRRRRRSRLIEKTRWAGYTAAAMATAVAGHEAAEAAVTHRDPDDILVKAPVGTPATTYSGYNNIGQVLVDLDNDGADDFLFQHVGSATSGLSGGAFMGPTGARNNMMAGFFGLPENGSYSYLYNLPVGATVSTGMPTFLPIFGTMAVGNGYYSSQFLNTGNAYLGLKFESAAGTHFGWMRVIMSGNPENSYTIAQWAYGMPGEPITVGAVPEPGCLGLLAFGGAGLLAWRRRRSEQVARRTT